MPFGSVSRRGSQRCVCFVTVHVAVVACSCALIRHSKDKKCLRTHGLLDSCQTFDFRRKHAHCIKILLSRSRLFSATCSCMWSLLMRWPECGEFCPLVAHSAPSSISQATLIGLQVVAGRKSYPSPLRGSSAWSVQTYRRVSTFLFFGTVTRESCYGRKKWNNQKSHYVVVFSAAVLY